MSGQGDDVNTQITGAVLAEVFQESSVPLSRNDSLGTLLSKGPCHGPGHISAGLQNVEVGATRRESRMDMQSLNIETPSMCEIGTAARSRRNGAAMAHYVIPETGGNGTDHDVTWCGGGYAYIETPHPRAKFCPKCLRLAKEYHEDYGEDE